MTIPSGSKFQAQRLGTIMQPNPADPREQWGTLNPGGARGPDGAYYLFPRIVAEGNYSRIGYARVIFDDRDIPTAVERLGYALEPREPYEVTPRLGGGLEDPRVTYIQALSIYVMAYTAFTPPHYPRIALAVSNDLVTWTRLGPLRYVIEPDGHDHNQCGNKDGVVFPDVVSDPQGRPCLAILHRPTSSVRAAFKDGKARFVVAPPPNDVNHPESIWISYAPLERVRTDINQLTLVEAHQILMDPRPGWESVKIGAGAPPVRLPYGWLLLYHGVSMHKAVDGAQTLPRYSAGIAILDLERPTTILYRSTEAVLEPETEQETKGIVPNVIFPTAADLRDDGRLDIYFGAADYSIGAARLTLPARLPTATADEETSKVHSFTV